MAKHKKPPGESPNSEHGSNGHPKPKAKQPLIKPDLELDFKPDPKSGWPTSPLSPEDQRRKKVAEEKKYQELRDYYRERNRREEGRWWRADNLRRGESAYAAPSPESDYWRHMIGPRKLTRYKYKPPLNHPYRRAPRHVDLGATVGYERPGDRDLTPAEKVIGELTEEVGRLRTFTIHAVVALEYDTQENETSEHALDVFEDDERSILMRGILDNLESLLKFDGGSYGSYIASTVQRVQRWVNDANSILMNVRLGWDEHLALVPWGPHYARVEYEDDPRPSRRHGNRENLEYFIASTGRAREKWEPRTSDVLHRLSVCAQILTSAPTTMRRTEPPGQLLPASYYDKVYRIAADTLRKACKAGRIRG